MYQYLARVIRVVDGDTLHLEVDLGFDVRRRDSFRLAHLNAPEMSTPEGVAARDWLVAQLDEAGGVVTLQTIKDRREKYGRYLAVLLTGPTGALRDLNEAMVDAGHAVPYEGGARTMTEPTWEAP